MLGEEFINVVDQKTKAYIENGNVVFLPMVESHKQLLYCKQMTKFYARVGCHTMALVYENIKKEIYRKMHYEKNGWKFGWRERSHYYIVLERNIHKQVLHGIPVIPEVINSMRDLETQEYTMYL